MKILIALLFVFTTFSSFAGGLDVHCGEIKKVKEKLHNPVPFPFSLSFGAKLPAIKIKLLNAQRYWDEGVLHKIEDHEVFKNKFAFTDNENYEALLAEMRKALQIKRELDIPVYACMGVVWGLKRWHKIGSYSVQSPDAAFQKLRDTFTEY